MFVVGLTGGIGTGKSQVSKLLEELGAAVIDADLLGHEVYTPHTEAWQEVVEAFGEDVLTPSGEVDRKKLGAIVFSNAQALQRLNAIMHPRMYRLIEARISRLRNKGRHLVVLEAALLLEAKWTPLVAEVWVTTASEDQVVQRLLSRSNLDEEAVRARIRTQMPQAERVKHADVVISNNGTLAELREQVRQLWEGRILSYKGNGQKR